MTRIYSDVMDTQKIQLICGRHNYIASEKPPEPRGCKQCWEAWWWHKIATTPAHLRQQRLDEAISMARHANEAVERGEFDFEPLDRAVIEFEKDGEPDGRV